MKRTIFLTCLVSILLALPAYSAPNKHAAKPTRKAGPAHFAQPRGGSHAMRNAVPVRTARTYPTARTHNMRAATTNTRVYQRNGMTANRSVAANRATTARNNNRATSDRIANARIASNPRVNPASVRGANINRAAVTPNSVGNARVVNNWRDGRFTGQNYAAFRDYRRQWHSRSWWHNHYSRIILVSGGWWFWNAGYWYPAWGYDAYNTYYPYDGPIYGYGDLTPDQVIVNVQTQLRADGYYAGSVDGVLGSQTRRALAAFQADHGLAVTSGVDEPTLATLGLS